MLTNRTFAVVLALMLCGNQLAMAEHGISHLVAQPDHACTQCLHQQGQKHALADSRSATTPDAPSTTHSCNTVLSWNGACPHNYQSRAPPSLH